MPLVKVESPILSGNINADDVIAFCCGGMPRNIERGSCTAP